MKCEIKKCDKDAAYPEYPITSMLMFPRIVCREHVSHAQKLNIEESEKKFKARAALKLAKVPE